MKFKRLKKNLCIYEVERCNLIYFGVNHMKLAELKNNFLPFITHMYGVRVTKYNPCIIEFFLQGLLVCFQMQKKHLAKFVS